MIPAQKDKNADSKMMGILIINWNEMHLKQSIALNIGIIANVRSLDRSPK